MKKTIIGIIIGLLVGVGAVGAYLYFNNPKDDTKNNKEENKTENKEEVKKDEYYQFYFENGKIYYSLNKGEKKYLMDNVNSDSNVANYKSANNYLYDNDKLYYYLVDTIYSGDKVTGYKYNFSYIDLNTLEKSTSFETIESDKNIYIREINDDKVYYAYEYQDSNNQSYRGINEYSFKDKTTTKIIEKPVEVQSLLPLITIYNGVKYIQITDGKQINIYKIEDKKEEIIVNDVRPGTISKTFKILNDKLYYINNDLLFSYDINEGALSTESETLTSYFGNALVFSDMIAYVAKTGVLYVEKTEENKAISLKFDSSVCTECNNIYVSKRVGKNKLELTKHYGFEAVLDLNNVADIPNNEGGGSIANINKTITFEDANYFDEYLEFIR